MRIKSDFVTNSSSASCILYVEMTEAMSLGEFKKRVDKYFEDYKRTSGPKPYETKFEQLGERIFKITEVVGPGWGGFDHFPYWMLRLAMLSIRVRKRTLIEGMAHLEIEVEDHGGFNDEEI